jgi:hypothetical protein
VFLLRPRHACEKVNTRNSQSTRPGPKNLKKISTIWLDIDLSRATRPTTMRIRRRARRHPRRRRRRDDRLTATADDRNRIFINHAYVPFLRSARSRSLALVACDCGGVADFAPFPYPPACDACATTTVLDVVFDPDTCAAGIVVLILFILSLAFVHRRVFVHTRTNTTKCARAVRLGYLHRCLSDRAQSIVETRKSVSVNRTMTTCVCEHSNVRYRQHTTSHRRACVRACVRRTVSPTCVRQPMLVFPALTSENIQTARARSVTHVVYPTSPHIARARTHASMDPPWRFQTS